jgi:outer membrane protein OmpA-like peptidoglycan-associated protein
MMKKLFSLIVIASLFVSCAVQAQGYTTKNKKAIAYFKKALAAPNGKNPGEIPTKNDYKIGVELAEKALTKDPNFIEAHLLAGEYCEYLKENQRAIDHYQKAIQIDPRHTKTGATYLYLGNLLYMEGKFTEAIAALRELDKCPNVAPETTKTANKIISNAEFALSAMQNPTSVNPINMGPAINTENPEYFPTITVDGETFLFTRLIKDDRVGGDFKKQEDFYISHLDKDHWTKAEAMPTNINTVMNEGAPTISADGRSLIFVACALGDFAEYGENRSGKGACDMFITKKVGSRWLDPTNLPGAINTASWESQPSISSDGKTIYFVRRAKARGGLGDSDIYTSTLQADGTWSAGVRLPNTVNTSFMEESVLIHPDGKTLYFASNGHPGLGGLDIYVTRMDDNGNWSKPENLGYPINSPNDENSLLVNAEGDLAFFASDRPGGYGDLDIYYFEMPEKFRPTKTLYFDGLVFNAETKLPLAGKFSLVDLKTGKEVVNSEADKVNGTFTVSLPVGREYALSVSYPGYAFYSQNFDMVANENQEVVHKDVPLIPLTGTGTVELKNVFFDLGKATLRPESYIELNKLRDFLIANPTVKIHLGGHTDTRGDAIANLKLSDDRAKAVVEYLVKQSIDPKRLTSKGYGETMPKISDEEIAKMASESDKEKAHQENRRTEYTIVK